MLLKRRTIEEKDEEKAFEELFRKNYSRAFYYALDWVGDEETAKDVVCLNVLKHQAVEAGYRDEAMLKMELIEEEGDWHEEMLEKVEAAVEALNPQTRRVLDLCYFQGKKYVEAAEELGISANTVHKHISKAMAYLRESLFNKKY